MRCGSLARGAIAAMLIAVAGSPVRAFDASLIDAARREGHAVWYTSQIVDQFARPAAQAFEAKYGVKIDFIRADSNDVALRILNEGRAGKVLADVFDGTAAVASLKKAGLVAKWTPEGAKRFPADATDREGFWVGTNLYVLTPGFNTDLAPKGTEPKPTPICSTRNGKARSPGTRPPRPRAPGDSWRLC